MTGLALLAAEPVLAAEKTPIGEKIQFSGTTDSAPLPNTRLDDKAFTRFESLNQGNSISGVVEPVSVPSPDRFPGLPGNPRLLDFLEHKLDQKKNWIYSYSDELSRTKTLNEMFGVRETETSESSTKPRKALEEFFDKRNSSPAAERAANDWTHRDRNGELSELVRDGNPRSGHESRFTNPFEPIRVMSAGFSFPGELANGTAGQSQGLKDFNRAGGDSINRAREQQSHSDDFRKLLATPGVNPLSAGLAPVFNFRVDGSRQEANPIAPGFSTGLSTKSPIESPGAINSSGVSSIPGILAEPGAKSFGPSSLSPVVTAPSESANVKAKPAVLEFPKRKF